MGQGAVRTGVNSVEEGAPSAGVDSVPGGGGLCVLELTVYLGGSREPCALGLTVYLGDGRGPCVLGLTVYLVGEGAVRVGVD